MTVNNVRNKHACSDTESNLTILEYDKANKRAIRRIQDNS